MTKNVQNKKNVIKKEDKKDDKKGSNVKNKIHKVAKVAEKVVKIAKPVIEVIKEATNHDSWYTNYPEIMKNMTGPNFNKPLGSKLTSDYTFKSGYAVPTAMGIGFMNSGLGSDDTTSNLILDRIITATRRANSGATNWVKKDLFHFIACLRDIITGISLGKWAYGTAMNYSNLNNSKPIDLFAAKGLDFKSFKDNLADLRMDLNNMIAQVNTYASINLAAFERSEWMVLNTFKDSADGKTQNYVFSPSTLAVYNDADDELGTVDFANWAIDDYHTGLSYDNYVTEMQNAINQFLKIPNMSIIAGDLVKAFGDKMNIKVIPYLDEMYSTPETYNEESLTQIQNSTPYNFLGGLSETPRILAEWDKDYLSLSIQVPIDDSTVGAPLDSSVVNFYKDEINNVDVIKATRCQVFGRVTDTDIFLETFGSEVFTGQAIIVKNYNNLTNYHNLECVTLGIGYRQFDAGVRTILPALWAAFDYAPLLYYDFVIGSTREEIRGLFDYNNYAEIDTPAQLQTLHNIAVMSLFYVPLLNKVNNNLLEIR